MNSVIEYLGSYIPHRTLARSLRHQRTKSIYEPTDCLRECLGYTGPFNELMKTILYYLECQIPPQYLEDYLDWRSEFKGTFKDYLIARGHLVFAYTLLVAAIDVTVKEISKRG